MDRLKLFRFATFQYFVEKFSSAEGLTDAIRGQVRPLFENSAEIRALVTRIFQMNTRERFRAISSFLDLLKTSDTATQTLTQPDWVAEVNKIFGHEDVDSSDIIDPAAGVYEFVPVKIPGGHAFDYLGTVLKGCSVVSLDELFISVGIESLYREELRETALNSWRVKCPYRGVHLYVKYQDAAEICNNHSLWPTAPAIIEWLQRQALAPPDNPADRQRLRLLEAIDTTKYIITFLGETPGKGHLVLLRASDGHVHVASFLRSCVGLPVRKQDVRDDHDCASLEDLLDGPVTLGLDDTQRNALTILQPDRQVTFFQGILPP